MNGQNETFGNACAAECSDVYEYTNGECDRPADYCPCTREYNPVCSQDGEQHYANPCVARCHGLTDFVACPRPDQTLPDPDSNTLPCACTMDYSPICADGVDYANVDCAVRCEGVTSYTHGRCDGTSGFEDLLPAQLPATRRGVKEKKSGAINLMNKKEEKKKQQKRKMIRAGRWQDS
jgi:hypothetical protein